MTPVKDNDIRVIRFRSLLDCLNSYLLCDLAKNQEEIQFTHYDKRTKSHSRIDYCFSNVESMNQRL